VCNDYDRNTELLTVTPKSWTFSSEGLVMVRHTAAVLFWHGQWRVSAYEVVDPLPEHTDGVNL